MFPVTIVILALHIILVFRLVFFNRYPQKVVNTETEPTLLQLFLYCLAIVLLSVDGIFDIFGIRGISIILVSATWMISKFYKRKKMRSE